VIPCKLIHDTGTMIRFRTSQLGALPAASVDIQVLLPTGRLVECHFNRHPQNPNVSGAGLVQYIKQRIPLKAREDVLVEKRTATLWVVHLLGDSIDVAGDAHVPIGRVRGGVLQPQDFTRLMELADRESERGRRLATYQRVLRPVGLRRMMIDAVGSRCMAENCKACDEFEAEWGSGSGSLIVEVHHIEHLARTIDHHPRNLCVLCANHHRFVHGAGNWGVDHEGPDVVLSRGVQQLIVKRPGGWFAAT